MVTNKRLERAQREAERLHDETIAIAIQTHPELVGLERLDLKLALRLGGSIRRAGLGEKAQHTAGWEE